MKQNSRGTALLVVVVVLVFVVLGAFIFSQRRPFTALSPLTPDTASDTVPVEPKIPPLYSGLQWGETKSGNLVFITSTDEVVKEEGYYNESVLLGTYPKGFFDYYQQELAARGWIETAYTDGPSGETYGYEKDGRYITVHVRVVSGKYQAILMHN